jgi:hypothetical protein
MRLATFRAQGRRQVGQPTDDGRAIEPFDLPAAEAERGALSVIERPAAGEHPRPTGQCLPLAEVGLAVPDAPIIFSKVSESVTARQAAA